jgi:aspartyl-tRNA(Asn)/glutamyl-tRNA(Gln) amidotransferase subunit C
VSISLKDIEKITYLARLNLSESEKEKYLDQINQILTYIEKLNELDTEDVEPLSHPIEITNVFRDEVLKESLSQKKSLENAPFKTGKFFIAPKVVRK